MFGLLFLKRNPFSILPERLTNCRAQIQIPLANFARLRLGRMKVIAAMFIAMHLMMREEKKMELPQMRRPQKQGRQTEI